MPTLRTPVRTIDAKTKEIDWRFDTLPNVHLSYFIDVEYDEIVNFFKSVSAERGAEIVEDALSEKAARLLSQIPAAQAAQILNYVSVSKAADILDAMAVEKVASICDSPNITSAKIKAILDTGIFTDADKIAALLDGDSLTADDAAAHVDSGIYTDDLMASAFNSSYLAVAKAASIFNNANLSVTKAASILDNANLSTDRAADIINEMPLVQRTKDIFDALSDARKDDICPLLDTSHYDYLCVRGFIIDSMTFKYRRKITITEQSGSDLTDYQVLIELDSTNFDFSHTQTNGEDIRFTDASGNLLDYWIESWDAVNESAKVWVKVPSIPANGTAEIYLYYGNDEITDTSDGVAVFEFFDDFEDYTTTDPEEKGKWSVVAGTVTIESEGGNKYIHLAAGRGSGHFRADSPRVETVDTFTVENRAWRFRARVGTGGAAPSYANYFLVSFLDTSNNVWKYNSEEGSILGKVEGGARAHLIECALVGTTWKNIEIRRKSTSPHWEALTEGVSDGTSTDPFLPADPSKIILWNDRNETIDFDDIIVRKYASPEPSVSLGAEETA